MSPEFPRGSRSPEEQEKRRLVAAALRGMSLQSETSDAGRRGNLLDFPTSVDRFERMIGLLAETENPRRRDRTAIFLVLWADLAAEMWNARNAHRQAMGTEGNWKFPDLLRNDGEFLKILIGLRWLAVRYRMGFRLDGQVLSALVHKGVAFTAAS